jgi:hypothetical protein
MGASEMRAQDLLKDVTEEEARGIAAASMGLPAGDVQLAAATRCGFSTSSCRIRSAV